jgi:hypothetical protein
MGMKTLFAVTFGLMLAGFINVVGIAADPPIEDSSSSTGTMAGPDAYSEQSRRVSLPYRFTRRGVEIRIDSIELSEGRVRINAALKETRGQAGDLQVNTLVQPETPNGQPLRFTGYSRSGNPAQTEPTVNIAANEEFSMMLDFEAPTASTRRTPVLVFPTGKWWSYALPKE